MIRGTRLFSLFRLDLLFIVQRVHSLYIVVNVIRGQRQHPKYILECSTVHRIRYTLFLKRRAKCSSFSHHERRDPQHIPRCRLEARAITSFTVRAYAAPPPYAVPPRERGQHSRTRVDAPEPPPPKKQTNALPVLLPTSFLASRASRPFPSLPYRYRFRPPPAPPSGAIGTAVIFALESSSSESSSSAATPGLPRPPPRP